MSMILCNLILWIGLISVIDTQEVKDGCIKVRMKEEAVCEDKEMSECGECRTTYSRECTITMREVWRPVRYKRCQEVRSKIGRCRDGKRRSCTVRLVFG